MSSLTRVISGLLKAVCQPIMDSVHTEAPHMKKLREKSVNKKTKGIPAKLAMIAELNYKLESRYTAIVSTSSVH